GAGPARPFEDARPRLGQIGEQRLQVLAVLRGADLNRTLVELAQLEASGTYVLGQRVQSFLALSIAESQLGSVSSHTPIVCPPVTRVPRLRATVARCSVLPRAPWSRPPVAHHRPNGHAPRGSARLHATMGPSGAALSPSARAGRHPG